MIDEERLIERRIPDNYNGSTPLAGFTFKIRNIIEGFVLGLIIGGLVAIILFSIPFIPFASKIGVAASFLLIGLLIGIKGINDEPVTVWLKNFSKFRKSKRIIFYNPHVREKTTTFAEEYEMAKENSAKQKLMKIYNRAKDKFDKADQEKLVKYQQTNYADTEKMFFVDDEGYYDKPVEYMNSSERKAFLKAEKKRIKAEQKESRKLERERRKYGEI